MSLKKDEIYDNNYYKFLHAFHDNGEGGEEGSSAEPHGRDNEGEGGEEGVATDWGSRRPAALERS